MNRQKKYSETLKGRLKNLLKGAKASSIKRGQVLNLTFEDIHKIWLKQEGKCYYTGWEMNTITGSDLVVSIERVDNTLGYSPDNCILVCWCVNRARNTMNIELFIEMCKAVSKHNK